MSAGSLGPEPGEGLEQQLLPLDRGQRGDLGQAGLSVERGVGPVGAEQATLAFYSCNQP